MIEPTEQRIREIVRDEYLRMVVREELAAMRSASAALSEESLADSADGCAEVANMLDELKATGFSDGELARRLSAAGCEVTQPTITRIRNGRQKSTSYDVGKAIERLHASVAGADSGVDKRSAQP